MQKKQNIGKYIKSESENLILGIDDQGLNSNGKAGLALIMNLLIKSCMKVPASDCTYLGKSTLLHLGLLVGLSNEKQKNVDFNL